MCEDSGLDKDTMEGPSKVLEAPSHPLAHPAAPGSSRPHLSGLSDTQFIIREPEALPRVSAEGEIPPTFDNTLPSLQVAFPAPMVTGESPSLSPPAIASETIDPMLLSLSASTPEAILPSLHDDVVPTSGLSPTSALVSHEEENMKIDTFEADSLSNSNPVASSSMAQAALPPASNANDAGAIISAILVKLLRKLLDTSDVFFSRHPNLPHPRDVPRMARLDAFWRLLLTFGLRGEVDTLKSKMMQHYRPLVGQVEANDIILFALNVQETLSNDAVNLAAARREYEKYGEPTAALWPIFLGN